jgi:hypothetical protein
MTLPAICPPSENPMTEFATSEVTLMRTIHEKWGGMLAAAARTAAVSEAFLGALVAGESAGDPVVRRFESAVFAHILEVCAGRRAAFSVPGITRALGAVDFLGYISLTARAPLTGDSRLELPAAPAFIPQLQRAADLATSYGLTQIMGWHAVELYQEAKLDAIKTDPEAQLSFTTQLLAVFANKYDLDMARETDALFTCWNTGEPDGRTYDPNYVANGERRIQIYQQISTLPTETKQ